MRGEKCLVIRDWCKVYSAAGSGDCPNTSLALVASEVVPSDWLQVAKQRSRLLSLESWVGGD